jgi:hypothetical protein
MATEFFPPANRTAQWFEDDFGGARMNVNVGCLHTTEGTSWPSYQGGAVAPNLTAKPNMSGRNLRWRQHFQLNTSSRALANKVGGVETNTLNVVQVELVGTCDPKHRDHFGTRQAGVDYIYWPDAPAWALEGLADFMRWSADNLGIPSKAVKNWLPFPKSFGQSTARLTATEWHGVTGWVGHMHVPENEHGDPGDIDIKHLLKRARGEEKLPPTAPTLSRSGEKQVAHFTAVSFAQRRLGLPPTGVFDRKMQEAVREFRHSNGLPVGHGVIGPRVWHLLLGKVSAKVA